MTDYLLDLSAKPLAKKLVRQLKLPIKLPQPLCRSEGAWSAEPLAGMHFALGRAERRTACDPERRRQQRPEAVRRHRFSRDIPKPRAAPGRVTGPVVDELIISTQTRPSHFSKAARRLDRPLAGSVSPQQPFVSTGTRPVPVVHGRPLKGISPGHSDAGSSLEVATRR